MLVMDNIIANLGSIMVDSGQNIILGCWEFNFKILILYFTLILTYETILFSGLKQFKKMYGLGNINSSHFEPFQSLNYWYKKW